MEISGSRILLTGATGGLGRAIAQALHARGAELLVSGRNQDALDALRTALGGERVDAFAADLALREDLAALPGRVGRVDVLVHNAGLPGSGRLESFSIEQIDRVLDVNLRAAIVLTHALLPQMSERGSGQLVYVSSMSGKIPTARASLYTATKFGLRGFAGALRDDLHGSGVGVSVVFPGLIAGVGMQAGVELPRWVPTRSAEDVAAAVVKAIATNRPELDVTDPAQRLGGVLAALAPRLSARLRRMLPVEAIAERTARRHLESGKR